MDAEDRRPEARKRLGLRPVQFGDVNCQPSCTLVQGSYEKHFVRRARAGTVRGLR